MQVSSEKSKAKKTLNVTLTHSGLSPYTIKVDSHNITLMKGNATHGYFSSFETLLDRVAKLKALELTEKAFGEEFPLENYIKSLYKIKNVFNNKVVESLNEQLKTIRE